MTANFAIFAAIFKTLWPRKIYSPTDNYAEYNTVAVKVQHTARQTDVYCWDTRSLRSCCDSNAFSFSSASNLARSESKRRICLST